MEDEAKLDTLLNMFDTNRDGVVDFNEFVEIIEGPLR